MKLYIFALLILVSAALFAEEVLLDIMFTNDIHGGIDRYAATFMNPEFPPMLGGGGSAAGYIKRIRKMTEEGKRENLLIDAGDFFQGHPVGTMSNGKFVIDYFNMIGYDLTVVGNHEYDIGEEDLIETYKHAEFPILSCNIIDKRTGELVDYVQPYLIKEKLGIRFGIIGVTTTDTEKMSFPDNIKNVDFLPAKDALEKYVRIVREEEEVDVVIVVGHMGLPYDPEPAYQARYHGEGYEKQKYWGYDAQELAHEVEGIDVFFGGHMHKGFPEAWEDPVTHTLVFQGWAMGSSIGHVTLKFDRETRSLTGYDKPSIRNGVLLTLIEDEFIPDPEIADTIATMQAIAEKGMDDIIGEASEHISKTGNDAQNEIGNLVCEAMLFATEADFAFLNLGGVRGELQKGPIAYRDIFQVMPFDNQVVILTVDGSFLKKIIETRVAGSRHGLRHAGGKIVYSREREDFDRVTSLEIGGEPWRHDKIYYVATTDFLLQGNAGLTLLMKLPESKIIRPEMGLRDAIVDYIRLNSPVNAKIDDRWKRDDSSELTDELKAELERAELQTGI